ncbi:MAG: hypothetical protein ACYDA6_00160 [Solirubrobacteraceae bacterium]
MKIRHHIVEERMVRDRQTDERKLTKVHVPSGTTRLSHDGEDYEADARFVFDVPEHVGRELVGRVGWQEWTGEADEPAAAEDDEKATMAARIAELEAALESSNKSRAAKPRNTK